MVTTPEATKKDSDRNAGDVLRDLHTDNETGLVRPSPHELAERASLKAELLRQGVLEEVAEKRLIQSYDRAENTPEDRARISHNIYESDPARLKKEEPVPQEKSPKEDLSPKKQEPSESTFAVPEDGLPRDIGTFENTLKGVVAKTDESEITGPVLMRESLNRRVASLSAPFEIASLNQKQTREVLSQHGLTDEWKAIRKEGKALSEFLDVANSSGGNLDPLVIASRYGQWERFLARTEQLYATIESTLGAKNADASKTVGSDQEASPASRATATRNIRLERREDNESLGFSHNGEEDVIVREQRKRAQEKALKQSIKPSTVATGWRANASAVNVTQEGKDFTLNAEDVKIPDSFSYTKAEISNGEVQTEKSAYEIERGELKGLRDTYRELKDAYTKELQRVENRGAFKKLFGIGKMPPQMEAKYLEARQQYASNLDRALKERNEKYGTNSEPEKTKAAFYRRYVENESQSLVTAQYESLPPGKQGVLKKAFEAYKRQPAWRRYLGSAALGSTIAVATGGVGTLGAYAARFGVGVLAGKGVAELAHNYVQAHGEQTVEKKREVLTQVKHTSKEGFSIDNLNDTEVGYRGAIKDVKNAERSRDRNARIAGVAGGIIGGGVAGGVAAGSFDSFIGGGSGVEQQPIPPGGAPEGNIDAPDNTPDPEVQPENPNIDADLPDVAPAPESPVQPEDAYTSEPDGSLEQDVAAAGNVHVVAPGENAWNIMEGSGPDSNPVGGKSEVVGEMSLPERRAALSTLFNYMEQHPDFTREVGISSGNPDMLKVGDEVNVSMMDEKLRELLGRTAMPEAVVDTPDLAPAPELPEVGEEPAEAAPSFETNPNNMVIGDLYQILERSYDGTLTDMDIARLEALQMDPTEVQQLLNTLYERGGGEIPLDVTVEEFMRETPDVAQVETSESESDDYHDEPPVEPLPEPEQRMVSTDNILPTERPSFTMDEATVNLKNVVVPQVEGSGGWLDRLIGGTNAGTFAKLENVPLAELRTIFDPNTGEFNTAFAEKYGVTQDGVLAWANWLDASQSQLEADNRWTLGEYMYELAHLGENRRSA